MQAESKKSDGRAYIQVIIAELNLHAVGAGVNEW